jgi:hypothetical protein
MNTFSQTLTGGQKDLCYHNQRRVVPEPWLLNYGGVHSQMKVLILKEVVAHENPPLKQKGMELNLASW